MKFWILNCNFAFLILIFKFFFVISSAHAWKMPIEVSTTADNGGKIYNRLVIGIEPDATDGYDNLWDAPALITSSDPEDQSLLRAYFVSPLSHPLPSPPPPNHLLWKDIRGPAKGNTTWDISVDSVPAGRSVVIRWAVPQGVLKPDERLILRDNNRTGADDKPVQTEMIEGYSYAFLPGDEGTRSVSLILSNDSGDSRSDSDSGFGCGTIRPHGDGPPDGGTAAMGVVVLFLPLVFIRFFRFAQCKHCLRRLTHLRLSI